MDGYAGFILSVDLTHRSTSVQRLPEEWKRRYIGGRGVGVRIVLDLVDPLIDPLSDKNILVFAAGLLTGSKMPMGSRYDVVTKSPLTGTLSTANSGGFFGTEMKRAGFDVVVIGGKSNTPVYLWINDGTAEIRDASALWGKTTGDTTTGIQGMLGDPAVRVACIGPAGEHQCLIAAIINERSRAAARGGTGAVMGSKLLKAIAVKGTGAVMAADPARFAGVVTSMRERLKTGGLTSGGLNKYGTAALLQLINQHNLLPVNNHQQNSFADSDKVSGEELARSFLKNKKGCYSCPVACGRECEIDGQLGGGPEYETIWAFGPDCGVSDLRAIIRANNLCNDYGLDTISTGVTIACAMELSEKGYLPYTVRYGDKDAIVNLVRMIAYRAGIGDELADGSFRFAARYGHPELSMSAKKLEVPAYDPRGLQGQGLEYATSVRGACHVYGNMLYPELLGVPVKLDPFVTQGKAHWTKTMQDLAAAVDASGMCLFGGRAIGAAEYAAMVSALTGWTMDEREFLQVGERIWNLQKIFNLKAGFGRDDDTLPQRMLSEPLKDGAPKGQVWHRDALLSEYYAERGWDEQGWPTKEKLTELGIG
ncbi:MAG: aldehyde ferredoxin oxidoreductase family protein [Methanoregula sp.]|nr:MAG: aldehyde ferredoxin oxidoreductase family protein [Methanoregula sp.]